MPAPSRQTAPARFGRGALPALALVALLGLPACLPSWGWHAAEAPHEPRVDLVEQRHAVYFETDRDELTAPEAVRLRAFVAGLGPRGGRESIRIEGHADERATDLYNLELSARRADRVAAFLRRQGIAEGRISTIAYGELLPAVPGSTAEAWRLNRRAEVVVRRHVVTLPPCPNWVKGSGADPYNQPSSQLGCATATNLARMVVEPADLVEGRDLGPADGAREAGAVRRYRQGEIQPLMQGRR